MCDHVCMEEMSSMEENGLPRCSSLMIARGVVRLADGDASQNIVLQTSTNQLLLVRGSLAEVLDGSRLREAYITKAS